MAEKESMVANMPEMPEGVEQCWGDVYGTETKHCLEVVRGVLGAGRHSHISDGPYRYMGPVQARWKAHDSLVRKIRRENPRPYVAGERDELARKLDFPRMLVDVDSRICTPLEQTIARAQKGIDEGLACLAEDERERYLSARVSTAMLALFPSGGLHLVTLERGKLRLWDDAEPDELTARVDAFVVCTLRGIDKAVDAPPSSVAELLALSSLMQEEEGCRGLDARRAWADIEPLIRSGRVCCADVTATEFRTGLFGFRDRAKECQALRCLVSEEGWPVSYASEAMEFMVMLHHLAGDAGYDVAGELIVVRDALESVLMDAPWAWDLVGCGQTVFDYEDEPCAYEDRIKRFRVDAHAVLDRLRRGDCSGAKEALSTLYQTIYKGRPPGIGWGCVGRFELGHVVHEDEFLEDIVDAYELRCIPAVDSVSSMIDDLECLAAEKRSVALARVSTDLAGLPVGLYPAELIDLQGLSLQTRLDDLRFKMDGIVDEVGAALLMGRMNTTHALQSFVAACMEAFLGVPHIAVDASAFKWGHRPTVSTVSGPVELSDEKLGISQRATESLVWNSLDVEAQEGVRAVLARHWAYFLAAVVAPVRLQKTKEALAKGCDVRSWIKAGEGDEQGRLASFLAVLHRVAYHGGVALGSGIYASLNHDAFFPLMNLARDLDNGLASLGFPRTGLYDRCAWMHGMQGERVGMQNAIVDNGVLLGFDGAPAPAVSIPESVTAIGPHAFWESSVRVVRLPDTLERIGGSAFCRCRDLKEIVLPKNLELVAANAFYRCSALERVVLPSSVISIESSAFAQCSELRSVEVSGSCVSCERAVIGAEAFANCTALESLSLPLSLTAIGPGAFAYCSGLKEVWLPSGVRTIGGDAFLSCAGLSYIVFPRGLVSIGRSAFKGCNGLTLVWIPDNTRVDQRAFMDCSGLKGVRLPQDTLVLSNFVFAGCSSLSGIDLPEGLEVIEEGAFEGCSSLASVLIPSSVKKIGRHAFFGTAIREVVLPEGVQADGAFEDGVTVTYGA